jgi:signal peptidase I
MKAPPRLLRALFAWLGYSSVHWIAGRYRRAIFWDALLVAVFVFAVRMPLWAIAALLVAQIADAVVIAPRRERGTGIYALGVLVAICVGVLVQTAVRTAWVEAFKIPAGSMIPALQIGDHIWVAKTARTPARGDVIVFRYPKEPDKDFVKRVVAVGGDTIEIRDDQLVLNGQPVPRQHVDEPCEYQDYDAETGDPQSRSCDAWDETLDGHTYRVVFDRAGGPHASPPFTVPADSYYVLGDNRDNSHDSRFWGSVPRNLVKGTARTIWWPLRGPFNRPIR